MEKFKALPLSATRRPARSFTMLTHMKKPQTMTSLMRVSIIFQLRSIRSFRKNSRSLWRKSRLRCSTQRETNRMRSTIWSVILKSLDLKKTTISCQLQTSSQGSIVCKVSDHAVTRCQKMHRQP